MTNNIEKQISFIKNDPQQFVSDLVNNKLNYPVKLTDIIKAIVPLCLSYRDSSCRESSILAATNLVADYIRAYTGNCVEVRVSINTVATYYMANNDCDGNIECFEDIEIFRDGDCYHTRTPRITIIPDPMQLKYNIYFKLFDMYMTLNNVYDESTIDKSTFPMGLYYHVRDKKGKVKNIDIVRVEDSTLSYYDINNIKSICVYSGFDWNTANHNPYKNTENEKGEM